MQIFLNMNTNFLTFDTNVSMNNIIYSTQIHSHETLKNQHNKGLQPSLGGTVESTRGLFFPSVEGDGGAVATGFGVGTDK